MKKLILVSMLYQVTDLVRTIEPELAGKTVTYIPTAGIAEETEGMIEDRRGFPSCRHKPGDETAGVGTAGIPERKPAIGFHKDRIPQYISDTSAA